MQPDDCATERDAADLAAAGKLASTGAGLFRNMSGKECAKLRGRLSKTIFSWPSNTLR